jgi:hypothetical protein
MHSDSFGSPCKDVARYVSAGNQAKRESRSRRNVSSYSGILYPQPLWIEDFVWKGLDRHSVSLAN